MTPARILKKIFLRSLVIFSAHLFNFSLLYFHFKSTVKEGTCGGLFECATERFDPIK
jgi:hypothetical protein